MADGHDEITRKFQATKRVAELVRERWEGLVAAAVKDGDPPPPMPFDAEVPDEPIRPRIVVADTTTERLGALAASLPRGLINIRDELAGWLNGFGRYGGGGADRAFALEMFGGRFHVIDRVKNPKPIRIKHLSIGVLGGIQPERLAEALEGADDGLAARFLWAWPDVIPVFSLGRSMPPSGKAKEAFRRLVALPMGSDERGNPEPVLVRLDREAETILEAFARRMIERERHATGIFAGTIGKARGHALRLACVLTFLRWAASGGETAPPDSITGEVVGDACRLVEWYFLPMAERVLGDAAIPIQERHAMILARHLQKAGEPCFNAREVRRTIGGQLREAKDMDAACAELVEAGILRATPSRDAGTKGRQAKNYSVNPRLFEAG